MCKKSKFIWDFVKIKIEILHKYGFRSVVSDCLLMLPLISRKNKFWILNNSNFPPFTFEIFLQHKGIVAKFKRTMFSQGKSFRCCVKWVAWEEREVTRYIWAPPCCYYFLFLQIFQCTIFSYNIISTNIIFIQYLSTNIVFLGRAPVLGASLLLDFQRFPFLREPLLLYWLIFQGFYWSEHAVFFNSFSYNFSRIFLLWASLLLYFPRIYFLGTVSMLFFTCFFFNNFSRISLLFSTDLFFGSGEYAVKLLTAGGQEDLSTHSVKVDSHKSQIAKSKI